MLGMKKTARIYLSLGSNRGDRMNFLQWALDALHEKVGSVRRLSSVYETASWGFEAKDFLNCCVGIDTTLSPEDTLGECLTIERKQGRHRVVGETIYRSRTLDIDILFYGDEVLGQEELRIPHPRLHQRAFVLAPLAEIAPSKIHPLLQKTIQELWEACDKGTVEKIDDRLVNPSLLNPFPKLNYLAIEGNIGAGKTSLATKIASDFNGKLILERFEDNPFLPKFYEDPGRYAFPLEMSFLADRYQQFIEDTTQLDLFRPFMVSDYDIHKSLIFAQATLSEDEYRLYRKLFHMMYKDATRPNLYVCLYQNWEGLLRNIQKRGREYEQQISEGYLKKIHKGYMEFIKTQHNLTTLIIDVSQLDFVNNEADYEKILKEIQAFSEDL